MKLIATMMLTVDGVYQGPGGTDEDRRGGFDRGGWTAAYADSSMGDFLTAMFDRADALLLGRRTWEIWESYWPLHDDNPFGRVINRLPKHVPSTTLKDPAWQHTHVMAGDVEAAVRRLKAQPGNEIQVHGSGELMRWLLERDLVDELNLRIYPVVVGDGLRLFPDKGQTHHRAHRLPVDVNRGHDPDVSAGRPGDLRGSRLSRRVVEATTGIEPVYAVLQTAP